MKKVLIILYLVNHAQKAFQKYKQSAGLTWNKRTYGFTRYVIKLWNNYCRILQRLKIQIYSQRDLDKLIDVY